MSDLIKRLRLLSECCCDAWHVGHQETMDHHAIAKEAADEIERLTAELEATRNQAIAEGRIVGKCNKRIEQLEAENKRLTTEYWREHAVWQKDRKENRRLQAIVEQLEGALYDTYSNIENLDAATFKKIQALKGDT